MNRLSFLVAHGLAIIVLIACWLGGIAFLIAVVGGYADAWLLLLAGLFLWFGYTGTSNLREWFTRIPECQLSVKNNEFRIGNKTVSFENILIINCKHIITQKRQNFVKAGRDFTVLAEITDRQGKVYKLRAGQGPVTWFGPSYGAEECKRLLLKLRAGHRHTSAPWTTE